MSVPITETSTMHFASFFEASVAVHSTCWLAPTGRSAVSDSQVTIAVPLVSATAVVRASLVPSSTVTDRLHEREGTTESARYHRVCHACKQLVTYCHSCVVCCTDNGVALRHTRRTLAECKSRSVLRW